MAEEPDGAAVVRRLLRTAYVPAPGSPEPEVPDLQNLVRRAVLEPRYADRFDAATALRTEHGERAVPELLAYLKAPDADARIHAYLALIRLQADAVLPLAAAARTEDPEVRRFVAGALGAIGDPRALPVVLELAEAEEPGDGRSPATRAARKLRDGAGGWIGADNPVVAHRDLARRFYEGDRAAARFPSSPPAVWTLVNGQLVSRAVDRHLYFIELGKAAAEDALRLDRRNEHALAWLGWLRESEALAGKLMRDLVR